MKKNKKKTCLVLRKSFIQSYTKSHKNIYICLTKKKTIIYFNTTSIVKIEKGYSIILLIISNKDYAAGLVFCLFPKPILIFLNRENSESRLFSNIRRVCRIIFIYLVEIYSQKEHGTICLWAEPLASRPDEKVSHLQKTLLLLIPES